MSLLGKIFGAATGAEEAREASLEAEVVPAPAAHPLEPVLGRHLLEAYLRERHLAMEEDLSRLDGLEARQVELLIRGMAAAAHADGGIDTLERTPIDRALSTAVQDVAAREALASELEEPPCLEQLVRQLESPEMAARFYAVSVRTVRRGLATNGAYLAYLANRLKLPQDLVVRLDRRFDVPLFFR